VFVLTDGQVHDREAVFETIRKQNESVRVHSFGVGSGCDQILVNKMAEAGRGSSSFVYDNSSELNGLVVTALSKAMQPSLKNCTFTWTDSTQDEKTQVTPEQLNEVFRNQSVILTRMLTQAQADHLKVKFHSDYDPVTKMPIDLEFSAQEFTQVTGDDAIALFKATANEIIVKEQN